MRLVQNVYNECMMKLSLMSEMDTYRDHGKLFDTFQTPGREKRYGGLFQVCGENKSERPRRA